MYTLITTDNGVTINEHPIDGIETGKAMLECIAIHLRRKDYCPIITHNGTGMYYVVEEIDDLGATKHFMEIGIRTNIIN